MNKNILQLYNLAQKESRMIIGLMSGTSLDGLDVVLCDISGSGTGTKVNILQFETVDYTEEIKIEIRKVFAKKSIDFEHLCLLNEWIGNLHAEMILKCLEKWNIIPVEIDLIASHGQTVYHAPQKQHGNLKFPNATLQIGDGDHIAVKTGIITISDFRQKHLAAGGEGAPLAVYGDYLLFSKKGENRIMLNIGGIANFTYLPSTLDTSQIFSTDVGPGNTLIDAITRMCFPEKSFDKGGEIARSGKINPELLNSLLTNPFFEAGFPKTTGPEVFSMNFLKKAQIETKIETLSPEDLIATLTRFSAEGISLALHKCFKNEENFTIYMSGGGMHNPVLVNHLKELLPNCIFKTTADESILPDAKESVLFAVLANETVAGGNIQLGNRPGIPDISMGKISFPY